MILCIPEEQQVTRFLKIKVPSSVIYSDLNLSPDILQDLGGVTYVRLHVEDNKYQPTLTGEATSLKTNLFSVRRGYKGFSASLDYNETDIRLLITRIIKYSYLTREFVVVLDYLNPEEEDYKTTGFTVRQGILTPINDHKGTSGTHSEYTNEGFSLNFQEKNLRYV
jgi:hypothetical protein